MMFYDPFGSIWRKSTKNVVDIDLQKKKTTRNKYTLWKFYWISIS